MELTSWKEVASYLAVSTRTAQRWERIRGLPVHRLVGRRGRIWAHMQELEQWRDVMSRRCLLSKPKSTTMNLLGRGSLVLACMTAMAALLRNLGLRP